MLAYREIAGRIIDLMDDISDVRTVPTFNALHEALLRASDMEKAGADIALHRGVMNETLKAYHHVRMMPDTFHKRCGWIAACARNIMRMCDIIEERGGI